MVDAKTSVNAWRAIIGGSIGNLTEWYNFLLYGYLATMISPLFFPTKNPLLSLTLVFTLFALSFLIRPVGGVLLGYIGDTYGRKNALIISLLMMGIPTFFIAILPTYAVIGILSPLLLCLFRLLQGMSAGGEHTGSAIYLAELAPHSRRALWVATVPTSAALGLLMSSMVVWLLVHFSLSWRVGYFFGVFLFVVSLYFRLRLPESPDYKKILHKEFGKGSFFSHLKIRNLLINFTAVIALASSYGIIYQILFIWMPTYLISILHLNESVVLQLISVCLFVLLCLYVVTGWIADIVGRKLLLLLSCAGFIIFTYPLFILLTSSSLINVYLAMSAFTLLLSVFVPTAFLCMLESFAIHVRYTGFSLSFNLGLAVFGGTCPLLATWLISVTHNVLAPAYYLIFAAVIALIASCFIIDDSCQQ